MQPIPLSVFIIAKNEADRIGQTLESMKGWVSEIIVIDSGSTDATVEVAQSHGATVLQHDWQGYGVQKRYGEEQCKHEWVLNIDADEVISVELANEIQSLFQSGKVESHAFWRMRIYDTFPHEKAPAPWAYNYNQIRLYKPAQGRFSASPVHDSVLPDDKMASTGQLEGKVAHRSIRSLSHEAEKLNRYSDMQVRDMAARGKTMPAYRLITEFPMAFLKAYVLRKYMLYGLWGVAMSVSFAYYRFMRVAKMYEAGLKRSKI